MSDVIASAQTALTDFSLWVYHGFFLPGDQVLSFLKTHAPRLAQLLEPSASLVSGVISGVVWLGVIVLIVVACRMIRDFDRAVTAYIGRLSSGVLRAGRIVARRVAIGFRSYQLKRQARLARTEVSEHCELSALELVVLRFHARLAPGHLSTASGTARALKMNPSHVQRALTRLNALSLVNRTFGAGDGEDGYRLTQPGRVFLSAYSRAQ
jgi:DNA-binding MarR family transcriptional regulator